MREREQNVTGDELIGRIDKYIDEEFDLTVYYNDTNYYSCTMHDVVTPNFKVLQSQGKIINNPMDRTTERYISSPCHCNHLDPHHWQGSTQYVGDFYQWLGEFLTPDSFDITPHESAAKSKVWNNVSASKATMLVTLGEANKSVLGIIDILKRLNRIFKLVKKLQFSRLKKELSPSELIDRWLEVRYGLRPLVYDAKQIIDALAESTKKLGDRQTFRGYVSGEETTSDRVISTWYANLQYYIDRSATWEYEVRTGVLAQLTAIVEPDIWGIFDVPQAVFDLTTFSFVANWFFNLADFVGSWTPSVSYTPLASWIVSKTRLIQSNIWSDEVYYRGPDVTGQIHGGYRTLMTETTERLPDPSRPILPVWNVNLDALKLVDLVALSKGFFTSIPRLKY